MRLKTKLVLAITGLVFLVVCTLSWIYVNELLRQRMSQAYAANEIVAHQVLFATRRALQTNIHGMPVNPSDHKAVRPAVARALRTDPALSALMDSAIRYSPTVFDVAIADSEGRALLSTDPASNDTLLPHRDEYAELQTGGLLRLLEVVFGPPRVYNVTLPVGLDFEPFATIRVGVRTTFLRFVVEPWLITALTYTGVAILCSLAFAAFLANLALKRIEDMGARLDALTLAEAEAGEVTPVSSNPSSDDAVVVVSHKIERIGRRMRNVEEVFSALKENLDQIMTNLQDGILLYTHDARAVLVSDSVERFLGVSRAEILGTRLHEVFSRNTRLGRLVRESFDARMVLVQEEITTETGRHVEISLDFIHDDRAVPAQETLGALLTLHDVESVREIESDLQLSRRLAAIGRLTAGVGHEVKNPINAIVVHLELLKNKLGGDQAPATRHLEVIDAEIHRLDRVVQTLVDFSRPVELRLQEQDLCKVIGDVLALADDELSTRNVKLEGRLPDHPLIVNVDADLLKQAAINVILNGAQAMPDGGALRVSVEEDRKMAVVRIADEGTGIPPEIREKIFDLYFTTKTGGSGIGLAMTYRIFQLNNGDVDVQSKVGRGTEFSLRIPLAATEWGRRHLQPAIVEETKGLET